MTAVQFNNEAIVFDNGSGNFKYGLAGNDTPLGNIPSVIGFCESQDTFEESTDRYIGDNAVSRRDTLNIIRPIERGKIVDWDSMEKLWEYIFLHELNCDFEHIKLPIILTAPSKGWKEGRKKMAQIMFEKFEVPGCSIFSQSLLSLFSTGNVTGLAIEFGDGISQTVPCYEGHIVPYGVSRIPIGGKDVTFYLQQLLKERCNIELTPSQYEIAQDIKEKTSYLLNVEGVRPNGISIKDEVYELPDGQIVTIDQACRAECGEVLFKPNLLSTTSPNTPGIVDIAKDTINKCDRTLQNEMMQNVVLSGGGSMIPGLPERFEGELKKEVNNNFHTLVDPHRDNAAWIGGSMLASMDTFRSIMITRQEYDEIGDNIVLRKFF